MASTHPDFPLSQWCKLVEQGKITLNLLRPSRLNPKPSDYSQVFGDFYYQNNPFSSPSMKVLAHVVTIDRHSFDPHDIKFLSVGVAMEYYCYCKIFITSNGGVYISDTVRWFPRGSLKLPIQSKD